MNHDFTIIQNVHKLVCSLIIIVSWLN